MLERTKTYRMLGFHWWKDSREILLHIKGMGGRMCVECKDALCVDTNPDNRKHAFRRSEQLINTNFMWQYSNPESSVFSKLRSEMEHPELYLKKDDSGTDDNQ